MKGDSSMLLDNDGTDLDIWRDYASNTTAGTGCNHIFRWTKPGTVTFRSYYRARRTGCLPWRFWFSNTVDSTYADASRAFANKTGGRWRIEAACVGLSPSADGGMLPGTGKEVCFGGRSGRNVAPDEKFWSDPVEMRMTPDCYLVFTMSITVFAAGDALPYTMDSQIPAFVAEGDCAKQSGGSTFAANPHCAKPCLLACPAAGRRIAFFGDSITQGCGTTIDRYEFWVARIAESLGQEYPVWNLGLGYARARDAASDGAWLWKAKKCGEIHICLGVNDIAWDHCGAEQLLQYLDSIVAKLKSNDSGCRVTLFTLPPLNFTGQEEKEWRAVNKAIRNNALDKADGVFDIAQVLCRPSPNENFSRFDPHPGAEGGREVAEAYLGWHRRYGVNEKEKL
jgi:lysophospholipase L1-like esterase